MNYFLGRNKGVLSPFREIKKDQEIRGFANIFSRKRKMHEEQAKTKEADHKESRDIIIKAFELGFLKANKRTQISQKLQEIKESMDRGKAIKDVLEFTVKSGKDQIIEDLKRIEN